MSKRKIYHVTQNPDGTWKGKAQGGQRASVVANTKAETVSKTTGMAKNQGNSQVIIHKMDGKWNIIFVSESESCLRITIMELSWRRINLNHVPYLVTSASGVAWGEGV